MVRKLKNNLGKPIGTAGFDNRLWIKKFEGGVKIRKKEEAEITLHAQEVFKLLNYLRKYPKICGCPIFLNALDLTYVWQKYPETKELIEKLLMDKLTFVEKEKIHQDYMNKINILKGLE